MADVHVELLRFGQPVPDGGYLIPLRRNPDGTPATTIDFEAVARGISTAREQGYTRIFIEAKPYA